MRQVFAFVLVVVSLFGLSACGTIGEMDDSLGEKVASPIASFHHFSWSGEVYAQHCYSPESVIDDQVLYTVGQLNGKNSVGRLDQLRVSNVETIDTPSGCIITYDAVLPVAWGQSGSVPEAYTFVLPKDLSYSAVGDFVDAYTGDCVDWRAHDVDRGTFWYYYRPERYSCKIMEADAFRFSATLTPNPDETEGMYPEYHKVWEDNALNVIAIFGKAKDGGSDNDVGVQGYGSFINLVQAELQGQVTSTEPPVLPPRAGIDSPVVVIRAQLNDGKTVNVNVFLIEKVTQAASSFWEKYEALTPTADYIIYNGHSGLGQNVRALARRGEWSPGQYSIVFMNGCDTYAYIDSALAEAHSAVNPDDPEGTKYLDIVANAMPSLFVSMPKATMAIFEGLLDYESPRTYEEILIQIDDYEVALVTGEHDNEYKPDVVID